VADGVTGAVTVADVVTGVTSVEGTATVSGCTGADSTTTSVVVVTSAGFVSATSCAAHPTRAAIINVIILLIPFLLKFDTYDYFAIKILLSKSILSLLFDCYFEDCSI
jgi:hypothetical protein